MRVSPGGEIVAGGDSQCSVELPGGSRGIWTDVARNFDRHVNEGVIHRCTTTGQVRPHFATEVCPVLNDAAIRSDSRSSVRCFGHAVIPLTNRLPSVALTVDRRSVAAFVSQRTQGALTRHDFGCWGAIESVACLLRGQQFMDEALVVASPRQNFGSPDRVGGTTHTLGPGSVVACELWNSVSN